MFAQARIRNHNAFTLVELIVVIIILAILSGVAIPRYFDYAAQARESSVKGTLGAVRSAIANFYMNSGAFTSTARYPNLVQLETLGIVMHEEIPGNPYISGEPNAIQAQTWNATPPTSGTTAGWNYDAAAGKFWANSDTVGENLW